MDLTKKITEYKLLEFWLYNREETLQEAEHKLNELSRDGWKVTFAQTHLGEDARTGNAGSRLFVLERKLDVSSS